jgi:hypothetical protein
MNMTNGKSLPGIEEGWDHCAVCGEERLFRRRSHNPWFCTVCGTWDEAADVFEPTEPYRKATAVAASKRTANDPSKYVEKAHWWERFIAGVIDRAALVVAAFFAEAVIYRAGNVSIGSAESVSLWVFWVGFFAYPLGCRLIGQRTIGELGLGIKLRGRSGEPLDSISVFARLASSVAAYFGVGFCRIGPRWAGNGGLYFVGSVAVATLGVVSVAALS